MPRVALITGITGQDGYYLARYLSAKGYLVYGVVHAGDPKYTQLLRQQLPFVKFMYGDLTNRDSLHTACEMSQPDEVYNLAGQSRVDLSFDLPELTRDVNEVGVLRFLSVIRQVKPTARFYQASSGEIFGPTEGHAHCEASNYNPYSPYAASKLAAHQAVVEQRSTHRIFACSGICFNHESPEGAPHLSRERSRGPRPE